MIIVISNEAIEHVLMNVRFECGKIQQKTEMTINFRRSDNQTRKSV